ncbi:hypothetical protein JOM56_014792 [Amanita muscaria]|uniref:Nascent polypeptide-associated complex subunit alpha-like UBA domain-containing protein n=1 Tax=Amanita muscaria (strain Koide BX008) TaxID=946122 RepID=A0A0C2WJ93_AMAMK|nr:hypothetical protein M378DRAFT_133933 [Amanita muscaria Koide BX008]
MSSRSNGRPEPEVIVNFADGLSYSKGKLEEAFRPGGILEKPPPKPQKEALPSFVKKEDVELIISEFEIPKQQAERLLVEHQGDVGKALRAFLTPPS